MSNNTTISNYNVGADSLGNFVIQGDNNPLFIMDSEGRRKLPYQPSFAAYLLESIANQTGAGQKAPFIANEIIQNIGEHYNRSSGIFKAPVSGVYHFDGSIRAGPITDDMKYGAIFFQIGSREFRLSYGSPANAKDMFNTTSFDFSWTQYMEVNQLAQVFLTIDGNGNTGNTVSFFGAAGTSFYSGFSGYLLA